MIKKIIVIMKIVIIITLFYVNLPISVAPNCHAYCNCAFECSNIIGKTDVTTVTRKASMSTSLIDTDGTDDDNHDDRTFWEKSTEEEDKWKQVAGKTPYWDFSDLKQIKVQLAVKKDGISTTIKATAIVNIVEACSGLKMYTHAIINDGYNDDWTSCECSIYLDDKLLNGDSVERTASDSCNL